jgi:cellobiose-specific phosphotransferase system component IIC
MKVHQFACVSRLPSVAIAVYIFGLLFVTVELAFCVLMLTEYNKITNPDESISNAKIGLYVEIGLLSLFWCVGIYKLVKLFKGTYC